MSNNALFFQRINPGNPPEGTVLAANIRETENGWSFIDDPIVGTIKANRNACFCVIPYMDTDDGSHYNEYVTHFIYLTDLERRIDILSE